MRKQVFNWSAFKQVPIVGIIRNISMEQVMEVLPLYLEAGLTTVEISLTTPHALSIIEAARTRFEQLNIGAGTVCDANDLTDSLRAGAQFVVSPITDERLITTCREQEIPVFPGAFTPTEIYRAWKAGATMVKVFPSSLGPQYIKDIKAPLPNIKLLPTGGIGLDNLSTYIATGADGFGIASQLFDRKMMAGGNPAKLLEHFAAYTRFFAR